MDELYFIVTIINRSKWKQYTEFYKLYDSTMILSTSGQGTATSEMLHFLGLESSEKAVIFSINTRQSAKTILKELVETMNINAHGTGVAVMIPMSSVGGLSAYRYLLNQSEDEQITIPKKGKGHKMANIKYELILIITNRGFTDMVMESARSAGATGGTVIHAKGTVTGNEEKFFGMTIADEKEMILIISPAKDKNRIMKAVMDGAGMNSEAQSIVVSLPVEGVVGLRSFVTEIPE